MWMPSVEEGEQESCLGHNAACIEPQGVVHSAGWKYVGVGNGGFDKVQTYNYVGDGKGAWAAEDTYQPHGWQFRGPCLVLLALLVGAVMVGALALLHPREMTKTLTEPYDCSSKRMMTTSKRRYCCTHHQVHCLRDDEVSATLTDPWDCDPDQSIVGESSWEPARVQWCCDNHNICDRSAKNSAPQSV